MSYKNYSTAGLTQSGCKHTENEVLNEQDETKWSYQQQEQSTGFVTCYNAVIKITVSIQRQTFY